PAPWGTNPERFLAATLVARRDREYAVAVRRRRRETEQQEQMRRLPHEIADPDGSGQHPPPATPQEASACSARARCTCPRHHSRPLPTRAANTEALSTASLACSSRGCPTPKASSATSRETVNPIPARTAIAEMSAQPIPRARDACRVRVISQVTETMPIGLPSTRPSATPMATGSVIVSPSRLGSTATPAVNSANSGTANPDETG